MSNGLNKAHHYDDLDSDLDDNDDGDGDNLSWPSADVQRAK